MTSASRAVSLDLPYPGDDPAALVLVAGRMSVLRTTLEAVAVGLARGIAAAADGWHGRGGASFAGRAATLADGLGAGLARLDDAVRGIYELAGVLGTLRAEVDRLRARAAAVDLSTERAAGQFIGPVDSALVDSGLVDSVWMGPGSAGSEVAGAGSAGVGAQTVAGLLDEISWAWQGLLAEAQRSVDRCASVLAGTVLRVPAPLPGTSWNMLSSGEQAYLVDLVPALGVGGSAEGAGRTPAEVRSRWAQEDPLLRQAELRSDARRLGNLDGLPAQDRDLANRAALAADLERWGPLLDRSGVSPEIDPGTEENSAALTDTLAAAGLSTAAVGALRGTLAVHRQLDRAQVQVDGPVELLVYEPEAFGGKGRAAIALGDVATADNVALLVPGMNSDVPGYLDNQVANAVNLFDQAAGGSGTTAVVAGIEYQAPGVDVGVTQQDMARQGAPWVVADLAGLAATRSDPAHVTVIGHSYGSTTVAAALTGGGGSADEVVLIGSPGVGTGVTADRFPAGADHVWVGSSSSDPVTTVFQNLQSADNAVEVGVIAGADVGRVLGPGAVVLGAVVGGGVVLASGAGGRAALAPVVAADLGQDPAAEVFGGRRFHAETPSEDQLDYTNHSRYYEVGSESLKNIAAVVTGDSAAVETAPRRSGQGEHYGWSDPEADHVPG
ncbi:hypothetical protein D1871_20945 [Nakamurella silvestris]|nr:hypothetical protein D1871_20945 [Nakamurella silvestris]